MGNKYTEEQLANILKVYSSVEEMERVYATREADEYLKNTDYVVIKIQEYSLLGKDVTNDYSDILKKREEYREILRKYDDDSE